MSYYADANYKFYSEVERRARKTHVCDACSELILPKQMYWRITMSGARQDARGHVVDSVRAVLRCKRCQKLHLHLRDRCLGWDERMWPDEKLDCGHTYQEQWDSDPPDEIASLAFAIYGD